jgi:hypothetical protein
LDSGFYEYGLIYRAQDPAHYYALVVGTDGYYSVVRVEGQVVVPLVAWKQFPHVERRARPNRLLITCSGALCTYRINDEYAATVEDSRWLSGDVGLWGRSGDDAAVIEFTELRMWLTEE